MADNDETKPSENIDEGLDLFSMKKKKKKAINLLIEDEKQETATTPAGVDQETKKASGAVVEPEGGDRCHNHSRRSRRRPGLFEHKKKSQRIRKSLLTKNRPKTLNLSAQPI